MYVCMYVCISMPGEMASLKSSDGNLFICIHKISNYNLECTKPNISKR